jgi:thiamine-phosphate pyrophosphorylase
MAQELRTLLPPDTTLLINDRADVARLVGGAGVHVGARDLPAEAARRLLGPDRIIGLSTHNSGQVVEGSRRPVDYLGFGPIFATRSKEDAEPVVGSEGLREARASTEKPLVVIGGIIPENVAEVRAAGADAVAVLSGWLAAADLAGRLEEFRQALGGLD